jgi:hypothetical protein
MSELSVDTYCEYRYGSAIGVVARVFEELIIKGQVELRQEPQAVLEHTRRAKTEGPLPPSSSSRQRTLRAHSAADSARLLNARYLASKGS